MSEVGHRRGLRRRPGVDAGRTTRCRRCGAAGARPTASPRSRPAHPTGRSTAARRQRHRGVDDQRDDAGPRPSGTAGQPPHAGVADDEQAEDRDRVPQAHVEQRQRRCATAVRAMPVGGRWSHRGRGSTTRIGSRRAGRRAVRIAAGTPRTSGRRRCRCAAADHREHEHHDPGDRRCRAGRLPPAPLDRALAPATGACRDSAGTTPAGRCRAPAGRRPRCRDVAQRAAICRRRTTIAGMRGTRPTSARERRPAPRAAAP